MKIKYTEALENVQRVIDEKNSASVVAEIPLAMKDAVDFSAKVDKHLSEVKKDLDDKAKAVITENPGTGPKVENKYTQKLKLDESLSDFNINSL